MLFENNQLIVRYKLDDTDELHSFCVDIKDFDTPTIYGKKIGELPKPTCPADKPYFGGWYTEADGAGTKYSTNSTAPSQDSLTLYAFYSAV